MGGAQPTSPGPYDLFVSHLTGDLTGAQSFFTLTPCRIVDTRDTPGAYGGPALAANGDRLFVLAGQCGVPVNARAVTANLTVTQGTALGDLCVYPGGFPLPLISSIHYGAGQTRANNAVLTLGAAGEIAVRCVQASGTVHFIVDVTGYTQ